MSERQCRGGSPDERVNRTKEYTSRTLVCGVMVRRLVNVLAERRVVYVVHYSHSKIYKVVV